MDYKKYLFAVFAITSLNDAVKVNMRGSLSFGKEVMDTISYLWRKNAPASRRRTMPFSKDADVLYVIIKSTFLCRDLDFCDDKLETFINEYIMEQATSIETIFEGIISQNEAIDEENKIAERLVFEEELKKCLRDVRKLLRISNIKIRESSEAYVWIEIIKKVSIIFQNAALQFANERLEGSPSDINEAMRKLQQKFLIATSILEGKYEIELCAEYYICTRSYQCTKTLNTLLGSFKDMNEDLVKIFIRHVSEALMESKFYTYIDKVTANEMQIILNDMAYSENISARKVLLSLHKTTKDRLTAIESKKRIVINGRDVELAHVILSDMDHLYDTPNRDPFHMFMTSFFRWSRSGSRLGTSVRNLLSDLSKQLSKQPKDLHMKLLNEVRAFLVITVDPKK